jgi:hypothetical protein
MMFFLTTAKNALYAKPVAAGDFGAEKIKVEISSSGMRQGKARAGGLPAGQSRLRMGWTASAGEQP